MADISKLSLDLPFPAATKRVSGDIKGIQTDVTTVKFSDKIMITISQKGRLGHWVRNLITDTRSALIALSFMFHWKTKTQAQRVLIGFQTSQMMAFFR